MTKMTITDFLAKNNNKKLKDISLETGLSISIISRLKTGNMKISNKTRKIFKDVYNVELIEVNEITLKNKELDSYKEENQTLNKKIQKIREEKESLNSDIYKKKKQLSLITFIASLDSEIFNDETIEKIIKVIQNKK